MDSESLKLRLAGSLWEEHGAGGVAGHLDGIDGLRVLFFFCFMLFFFYETVFLLASSYLAVPIACHFVCLSLISVFVSL